MNRKLVAAALLALCLGTAAATPAFARGQPQLPDDDGGRASVLHALDPESDAPRPAHDTRPANAQAAPIKRAPSAIPRAAIDALAAR